jgi:hypothetical protein
MGEAEFVWIEVRQMKLTGEELRYHRSCLLPLVQSIRVAIVRALVRGSAYKQEIVLVGCPVMFVRPKIQL